MNSLLHTLSALLSGAFLNLGFERLAERFDPVSGASGAIALAESNATMNCILPCNVPAEFDLAT